MENGQNRAVGRRVKKLVGVPTRRQRAGFRLAVTYHAAHEQIRIVEGRAVGVGERIAEFATFVNRPRRLWGHMTGDASGKGKLPKEVFHTLFIRRNIRVDLAVSPL